MLKSKVDEGKVKRKTERDGEKQKGDQERKRREWERERRDEEGEKSRKRKRAKTETLNETQMKRKMLLLAVTETFDHESYVIKLQSHYKISEMELLIIKKKRDSTRNSMQRHRGIDGREEKKGKKKNWGG